MKDDIAFDIYHFMTVIDRKNIYSAFNQISLIISLINFFNSVFF